MRFRFKTVCILGGLLILIWAGPAFGATQLFDVDANTVALWRFNETGGSIVKDETGINNGVTVGAPTFVSGKFGNAISFNGLTDYVVVPDNPSLKNLNQISVEAWVYPTGLEYGCGGSAEDIVSKGMDNTPSRFALRMYRNLQIPCADDGLKEFGFNGDFGGQALPVVKWHQSNQWLYVVLKYDGNYLSLYVNAELESQLYYPNLNVSSDMQFFINHHVWEGNQSSNRIQGKFDELRISNIARSAEEIKANYDKAINVKYPVVIVPGIFGSMRSGYVLDRGELQLVSIYDDLKNIFLKNGYVLNQDLFEFPYDWRRNNILSAFELKDKISEIKNICGCDKVNLVSHSMGGLVSRAYMESGFYGNDINKLVFLGTPQKGSPKAYLAWEGGVTTPTKKPTVWDSALKLLSQREGYNSRFDYARSLESLRQLLPVYDYLIDKGSSTPRMYPGNDSDYPRNTFLEDLNSNIQKLNESGAKFTNIIGDNSENNTYDSFRVVKDPNLLPLWEHGYPEGFYRTKGDHGIIYGSGDGTVPNKSANWLPVNNVETKNVISEHDELPANASVLAYEAITNKSPVVVPKLAATVQSSLIIASTNSQITVSEESGRKAGFGTVKEKSIPQSFYGKFFDNTPGNFLSIPNPKGTYNLIIENVDSNEEIRIYFTSNRGEAEKTLSLKKSFVKQGIRIKILKADSEQPMIQASPL